MLTNEQRRALEQAAQIVCDNGYIELKFELDEILASAAPAALTDEQLRRLYKMAAVYQSIDGFIAEARAYLLVSAAPAEGREALAWRVEWERGGQTWVRTYTNERDAIDDRQAFSGTVTPLYPPATAPTMSEAANSALVEAVMNYIGALDAWDGSVKAERYTKRKEIAMRAALAEVRRESPSDCSGDPTNCPDNEGRGCFCSDKERIDRAAAKEESK